jgi:Flp pilus assembly protein TadG
MKGREIMLMRKLWGRCFWRATAGNAAVEFAVIAPILVTLTIGVADFGIMANQKAALVAAARAGAEYARTNPSNSTTVLAIMQAYTGSSLSGFTGTLTGPVCECDAGAATSTGDCTGTCVGPVHTYVTVTATRSFSPILPFAGIVFPTSLTATVTTRVS